MDTSVMKVNAVANRALNPRMIGGGAYWNNNFGPTAWIRDNFTSGGHDDAPYIRLTAVSDRVASWNDRMYEAPIQKPMLAGQGVYVQYYVRCSVPIKLTPTTEFFSDSGANLGNTAGTTPTQTDIPANVWTKVSSFIKPNSPTAKRFSVTTYGAIVGTIPAGETLDYCKVLYVAGDHPTDYFDGNSPGCKWLGTPNNSISLKPELRDAPVMINAIPNYVRNPNFNGGPLLPQSFISYTAGTTITGTRSTVDGKVTLSANSLVGGLRRFGIIDYAASYPTRIKAGEKIILQVEIDSIAVTSGVGLVLYLEAYNKNNTILNYISSGRATAAGRFTYEWTAPQDVYRLYTVGVFLSAPSDNTDPQSVTFSKLLYTHIQQGASIPEWFDGDSPNCKWLNLPYGSGSIGPGLRPADAYIMTTDGLEPI